MAAPIRVGIVGATVTPGGSGWGANAHVPALGALPDYELTAVCTAHDETARASAQQFGARLAFHDIDEMAAHPDVDLVAVSVRVPLHHQLVMAALRAGKDVFCEWPLGATVAEAEEMANLARERGLRTFVGLQARSDPSIRYARDLVAQGYVGEVLTANLSVISQAVLERGPGRSWQRERANGANPLTIPGGHAMDALCFVLGEIAEVSARVTTRITEWRDEETGAVLPVDAPDNIAVAGRLVSGGEVAIHVGTVPHQSRGTRLEIYGRDGALFLTSGSANIGPNVLHGARAGETLAEMAPPDEYVLAPEGTPSGPPRNVAHAYARIADARGGGAAFDPDFDLAVTRHRLLAAIERSSESGRAVTIET
ncbi:MAG: Gfo/Idh/MocA family oxidoreductase [Chloroflexi bacterium]|nr:Gfo/Idh/MocA family oxidoreductase [Chloroflexota bacterium]MDA1001969.1 Gfo/Idh/MocA family oxidoreductase [Chloroflexota bacterium]